MINIQAISSGLVLDKDGIWKSSDNQNVSYPNTGHQTCFSVEDNSFWFKHRNDCITSVVRCFPPEKHGTIFDIGGGNGFVSLALANAGFNVVLVEPGLAGAFNAKRRGIKNVICATTDTAQFKPQSLSAVGLFDVIEHIENDLAFMQSIRCLIEEDGRLYITVPAYSFLWSIEDVTAGHFRRYNQKTISKLLRSAGFEIEFSTYIFRFLPVLIFILRTLPFILGFSKIKNGTNNASRDHGVKGGIIAKFFRQILRNEVEYIKIKQCMSFGGSCLVVARKPKIITTE